MENRWQSTHCGSTELDHRIYSSRLLGTEEDLVLHGGGNTSVKSPWVDIFGMKHDALWIKGSGHDLRSIGQDGFPPTDLKFLIRMLELEHLSDKQMMEELNKAKFLPTAPSPSVEALLHAIIPFKFVDHTHPDSVVAISNTPSGQERIKEIYPEESGQYLILPYVMPGMILAKQVYQATKSIKWEKLKAIILLHHGVFTFADTAKESYDNMIEVVTSAEKYLKQKGVWSCQEKGVDYPVDLQLAKKLSTLRKQIGQHLGHAVLMRWNGNRDANGFSCREDLIKCATQGPITPDHVLHTKRLPMILQQDSATQLAKYVQDYQSYFRKNSDPSHTCLDPAPRYAILPKKGLVSISINSKRLKVVHDIVQHTIKAIQWGQGLESWQALSAKDIFDLEYWELEQAKLKKKKINNPNEGKVVLVTGAASGIGRSCVENFIQQGFCVTAIDVNPDVHKIFGGADEFQLLTLCVDVSLEREVEESLVKTVEAFGGIDILVLNAGVFPLSETIAQMNFHEVWKKTLSINLDGVFHYLQKSHPYLQDGFGPQVIIMGSKNVKAPGPGVSAYSVSKAAVTQLARVCAMEWAKDGIRVQTIHPDGVFDTGIWSDEILSKRAKHYGMSVEEYKKKNLLGREIKSRDVAQLIYQMTLPAFEKTTGLQIQIDGGLDRTI